MTYLATFDENSRIIRVKIIDSASLTGAGKTGLTYASSGLVVSTMASSEATPVYYTSAAGTIEAVSVLGTYAQPTATKCRFSEVSATYHPGLYEIQLADARFSVAGASHLIVTVTGAAGTTQTDLLINLTRLDLQASTVTASSVTDKTGYSLTVTPPTAGDIDTLLTTTHGAGSWVDTVAPTVAQIDTQLSGTHGAGTWGAGSLVAPTVEEIDAQLSSTHGAGRWAAQGSGEIAYQYIVKDCVSRLPVDGVWVNVSTDEGGANIIAQGVTNAFGQVVFWLDPGPYFFWAYRCGYYFPLPDSEVVPAP